MVPFKEASFKFLSCVAMCHIFSVTLHGSYVNFIISHLWCVYLIHYLLFHILAEMNGLSHDSFVLFLLDYLSPFSSCEIPFDELGPTIVKSEKIMTYFWFCLLRVKKKSQNREEYWKKITKHTDLCSSINMTYITYIHRQRDFFYITASE